jgi:hypothetical protein
MTKRQRCRVCGCTQDRACVGEDGPCWWAESDLCSACATPAQITVAILDQTVLRTGEILEQAPPQHRAEIRAAMRRYAAARTIVQRCAAWQAAKEVA